MTQVALCLYYIVVGPYSGEPNNHRNMEFCVSIEMEVESTDDSGWGWNDRRCDERHPFVCKYEIKGSRSEKILYI